MRNLSMPSAMAVYVFFGEASGEAIGKRVG